MLDAINKAGASRATSTETVIHSDHGSQFTSWAFTENVRRLGLISSMGTVGDCYDNAPMESFWGTMQIELLNRQKWRTSLELAMAIADYIEHFYNPSPTAQFARLPHPERIRGSTLNTHPVGHFVLKSGRLNGVKRIWLAPLCGLVRFGWVSRCGVPLTNPLTNGSMNRRDPLGYRRMWGGKLLVVEGQDRSIHLFAGFTVWAAGATFLRHTTIFDRAARWWHHDSAVDGLSTLEGDRSWFRLSQVSVLDTKGRRSRMAPNPEVSPP